ncbi:hypothetical protein F3J45_06765 [Pantoea sp. Ap-967]|uniref:hypothetical protein n=1 Tax=Pantoea sp. Ap-967 TaxID=2608362 RepID=UPI001422F39B|nr:hypothetical protein [Pantoea sp. Ap-967]NIE74142.1 hypothetical protein [Pantoea sp. Ap-967]
MLEIEVSTVADQSLFEQSACTLKTGLGGRWTQRLDGLDERYWDLLVETQIITLHLQHYLGICVLIPSGCEQLAARVRQLLGGQVSRQH